MTKEGFGLLTCWGSKWAKRSSGSHEGGASGKERTASHRDAYKPLPWSLVQTTAGPNDMNA